MLRIVLGETAQALDRDRMLVMETQIDDMNPEIYDYVLERLFAAGARDVTLSPVQMKKNRPGTLLRILAKPELREALAEIVLRETSTLGVRCYMVDRLVLAARLAEAQDTLRHAHGEGGRGAGRREEGDAGIR